MKAIICTNYGAPEVLQLQEIPKPTPKENEILVRIIATTVNSGDVRVRALAVKGWMKLAMRLALGFFKPRKPVLGTVYAGIVESCGSKVSKYKEGDKVFGMTGFKFGTYAEYLTVREIENIALMPFNATYEEAASLIFGGQTAIYFLEKVKLLEPNTKKILIIGAAGSVGSAAVQIARHYGATVTAVCSSEGKSLVESLGVSNIVQYDREDFYQLVVQFDVVFDAAGKAIKKKCKMLLTEGGMYKTVAGLEVASESQKQLELLKELYENEKIKAVITKTFALEEVVEAHKLVETGRKKGNIVLKVSEEVV